MTPVPNQGHGGFDLAREGVLIGRKVENDRTVNLDRVGRQCALDPGGVPNIGPDGAHRGQGVNSTAMNPKRTFYGRATPDNGTGTLVMVTW